ncbi:SIMPL domain-containing protein [Labrys monachus]|uniref:Uncharacterized protein YggE n=1 Tax=Labrys monachus TaxID=217067 RepID=A0ABU0FC20_9HYPH|nr:SIMPL domain-containing protein [Labrys monachus]MDQ0392156.1 uncharacterized protein YggE [Labrys monachus]
MSRFPAGRPALAALLLAGSLGLAHADDARRSVSVNGEALTSARPDVAFITIGVESTGKDARDVVAANSKSTGDVIAALKADGVDGKDLQTTGFSVRPEIDRSQNALASAGTPPAINGYTVSNSVNVTLHDLTRLGEILDKAVTAGANSIDGIQFDVSNQSALLDDARKAAFEDARRKAATYAAASGLKLGRLIELSESTGPRGGGLYRAKAMTAAAVPVESGESTLGVSVSARFELDE